MIRMKKILLFLFLSGFIVKSVAQEQSPAQKLRLARATFEQGRLHEIERLLSDLTKFNPSEKVDAYKLLTQTYIYLEEPEQADKAMLNLLRTDHYFAINEAIDPAEFVALYKTFRTKPIYKLGVKIGPNTSFPTVTNNYYVGNESLGKGKNNQRIGFQFGVVFEKELFNKSSSNLLNKLTIAPELMFATRGFKYTNDNVFLNDSTGKSAGKAEVIFKQSWIDLNVIMQYEVRNNRFHPYVGVGPSVSYLLAASNQQLFNPFAGSTVSGPDVEVLSSYNKMMYSLNGLAGIKVRAGAIFLNAEVRFQYGLSNIINPKKRTNAESAYDYATQFNDVRQANVGINIGAVYPVFNPKKL